MGSLFTVPHLPSSVPTWQNQPGRLNQSDPKDPSFEKEDFVRFVAQESMPIGLSPRRSRESLTTRNWLVCATTSRLGTGLSVLCQDIHASRMNSVSLASWCYVETELWYPKVCKRWLELGHEGHHGVVKTKSRLKTKCGGLKWMEMWRECAEVVMAVKSRDSIHHLTNAEDKASHGSWQDVAADLMGSMPGGENLLVVVDYYSCFFEV